MILFVCIANTSLLIKIRYRWNTPGTFPQINGVAEWMHITYTLTTRHHMHYNKHGQALMENHHFDFNLPELNKFLVVDFVMVGVRVDCQTQSVAITLFNKIILFWCSFGYFQIDWTVTWYSRFQNAYVQTHSHICCKWYFNIFLLIFSLDFYNANLLNVLLWTGLPTKNKVNLIDRQVTSNSYLQPHIKSYQF